MKKFILNSRILLPEEKLLLFGVSNEITAIKVLDLDNYLALFEAIYNGSQIEIPALQFSLGALKIYIYCDISFL